LIGQRKSPAQGGWGTGPSSSMAGGYNTLDMSYKTYIHCSFYVHSLFLGLYHEMVTWIKLKDMYWTVW
jgi:hypothetical protein